VSETVRQHIHHRRVFDGPIYLRDEILTSLFPTVVPTAVGAQPTVHVTSRPGIGSIPLSDSFALIATVNIELGDRAMRWRQQTFISTIADRATGIEASRELDAWSAIRDMHKYRLSVNRQWPFTRWLGERQQGALFL
jgi:hypothetical protein